MSKISRDNKKANGQKIASNTNNTGDVENQNQRHNSKKEALGPNTKR